MARGPSWINKVNYIVDYWQNPCDAPLLVYLELALPPAGDALLTWFSFGLDDVLRGFYRPSKALGSNVRGRRGKEKKPKTRFGKTLASGRDILRKTPGFGDDVGNWIGKNLPGAQEIKGREIFDGERLLWMLDDVAQRALLALLIVDVGTDFLYEWAMLLNESVYCQRKKDGVIFAQGPGSSCGGVIICNTGNAPDVYYQYGDCSWETDSCHFGPGGWTLVSAWQGHNSMLGPTLFRQQANYNDQTGGGLKTGAEKVVGPGEIFSSIATWTFQGPGEATIRNCSIGGPVCTATHQDVTLFGGP